MRAPEKIILLVIDTLRADHLGCYGYVRDTSPKIDRLAADSVIFSQAFTPVSYTLPAIASLLTSKRPDSHGIGLSQKGTLSEDSDLTLAELLRDRGYATASFVSTIVLRKETELDAGFDVYDDELTAGELNRPDYLLRDGLETMARALEYIKQQKDSNFFTFIHLMDVHGPYACPAPYDALFVGDPFYGERAALKVVANEHPYFGIPAYQVLGAPGAATGDYTGFIDDPRYYGARYDGCIRKCDDIVASLVDCLKTLGIYDDTLFILTADHGEALGENGIFFFHGVTVTPEQISVPLLVKLPTDLVSGPRKVATHVSIMDLMPTILSACGIDTAGLSLHGSSLQKLIKTGVDPELSRRTLACENECQDALIKPDGTLKLEKSARPFRGHYAYVPEVIDLLDGKIYDWRSGKEITAGIATSSPICPVCGSTETEPLCMVNGYQIHRCIESETEFVWPMPADDTLKALYDRTAFFEGGELGDYQSYDAQAARSLPSVMKLLARFPNGGKGRSILEVGCGYGTRLRLAADQQWKCFGIEISEHARRVAADRHRNRLTVFERVADLAAQHFDLILMLEAIENFPNPFLLFFSLFSKGVIGPETLVVISTPNDQNFASVANPGGWTQNHPPYRLVHYSAKSLQLLLQRLRFREIRIAGAHLSPAHAIAPYEEEAISLNDDLRELGGIVCECRGSDFASFMKERYVPGTWSSLKAYEHLPRYALARTLAKGMRVLDFGCGTGYGAASLAEVAQCVVGVDIDAGAIEWARATHRRSNLHFERHADLGRGLAPGSFDLITCFEVIEHINHATQLELLRSMNELLASTGKLILSTPNPRITVHYGDNPYHLQEMTAAQFLELLQPFFKQIAMYEQWISPGILIAPRSFEDGNTASVSALAGKPGEGIPVACIALCSQEPFKPAAPLCKFDMSHSFAFQTVDAERRLDQLRLENYALKERMTSVESELASLRSSRMLRLEQVVRNEPLSLKKLVRIAYLSGAITLPPAVKHMVLSIAPWLRSRFGAQDRPSRSRNRIRSSFLHKLDPTRSLR
jgi:arylsulfatase A-like enzyme/2-polyprenyl-3-methyl-5-hydroxy-6-metoxy-1,4-benzoquinol methylase